MRELGLTVVTSEDFSELFDNDYTENQEYFREDTLSLGYVDEADRVTEENTNDDGTIDVRSIINHVFTSSSYYLQHIVEETEGYNKNGKKTTIYSIAYMTQ